MSQLLIPIYRGEVKILKYSDERHKKFATEVLGMSPNISAANLCDPTGSYFTYPDYVQWEINELFKAGYVAIGMEAGNWVFTKRENTIP